MNKTGVIGVVAAVLLLSGCASAGQAEAPTPANTPAEVAISATPTAAPITQAPATDDTSAQRINPEQADADFIAGLDYFWQGQKPETDQWIGAGHLACDQLSQGTAYADVRVVEGASDEATHNNSKVVLYATQFYCPEFTQE